MAVLSTVWGGTELTTTRIVVAVIAELLVASYIIWALRLFGR
jgi:hypothetical protein